MQGGESVLAYQTATGATGAFTVTDIISHDDTLVVALTLGDETLDTTPEHPFYAMLRGWVAASELRPGDTVRRRDGSYGRVAAVVVERRAARMYNLTIADAHTFFVGEEAWLVHNADCEPWSFGDLPYRNGRGKTSGYLVDSDGNRISDIFVSGRTAYSTDRTLVRGDDNLYTIQDHVEAQVAGWMRDNKLDEATLVLNNHPCANALNTCHNLLPRMLPPGAKLRILVPNGFDIRGVFDRVYEGLIKP